jgi:hypothetical protein
MKWRSPQSSDASRAYASKQGMKDDNSTSLTESASICAVNSTNYGGKEMYKFKDWKDVEEKTGDITHKQGIGVKVIFYAYGNNTRTKIRREKYPRPTDRNYQVYLGAMVLNSDNVYRFIKLHRCSTIQAKMLDKRAIRLNLQTKGNKQ